MIPQMKTFVRIGLLGIAGAIMGLLTLSGAAYASATGTAVSEEDLFIIPAPTVGKVEMIDELTVQNHSSSQSPLQFTLPDGATGVTVDGKAATAGQVNGNILHVPDVLKADASTTVTLTWTLPLSSQQDVQFTLIADHPVYTAHVYLPIGNSALSAEGLLTTTETVTISGTKFREFTRPGISQGDQWTLSVQMLPNATAAPATGGLKVIGSHPGNVMDTIEAVGNLVVVAVILGVGLLSIRATQWGRRAARKSQSDALVDGLVAIHRQYELGMIEEQDFNVRKEQLRQKLRSVDGRET